MVIIGTITGALLLLFIILAIRTALMRSSKKEVSGISRKGETADDISNAPLHLSEAIRFETVAGKAEQPFIELREYLKVTYPLLHAHTIELPEQTYALLFRIDGTEASLQPSLLCAHLDVVPASPEGWEHPPFAGEIADGFIWGRGSFDDKGSTIAILETFERMLREKIEVQRTWYIALGSDEEVRGEAGAALISSFFASQNIRFAFVLDEGGAVAQGFIPQVKKDIAVIGLSEKASLTATLTVSSHGGHSSTPEQPTSVGILARAASRIEHTRLKGSITYPVKKMLDTLALHSSFPFALIVGNSWLFRSLIIRIFSASATMNALVRSTAAVTMIQGAKASNIVPTQAKATVNIRTLPGERGKDIISTLHRITRDPRVEITLERDSEGGRISPAEGEAYEHLTRTIENTFPSAVAVPYLMSGASDALHYEKVSDNVYRFSPVLTDKGELARMHSENERLSVENLHRAIRFYTLLIQES